MRGYAVILCLALLSIAAASAVTTDAELSPEELSKNMEATMSSWQQVQAIKAKIDAGAMQASPALLAALADAQAKFGALEGAVNSAERTLPVTQQQPAAAAQDMTAALKQTTEEHNQLEALKAKIASGEFQPSAALQAKIAEADAQWQSMQGKVQSAYSNTPEGMHDQMQMNAYKAEAAEVQRAYLQKMVLQNRETTEKERQVLLREQAEIRNNDARAKQNRQLMLKNRQIAQAEIRQNAARAEANRRLLLKAQQSNTDLQKAELALRARRLNLSEKRIAEDAAERKLRAARLAAQMNARALMADHARQLAAARRAEIEHRRIVAKRIAAKRVAARRFAARMRMIKDAQHKAMDELKGEELRAKIEAIEAQRKAVQAAYDHRLDTEKDQLRTALKRAVEKARLEQVRSVHNLAMRAQLTEAQLEDEAARAQQRILAAYNRQRFAATDRYKAADQAASKVNAARGYNSGFDSAMHQSMVEVDAEEEEDEEEEDE